MPSSGKDFEARIKKRLEKSGAHWVRIPDDPTHFMVASKSKEGPRFTPKRPFDGTATWWDDEIGFLPVNLELKTCADSRMEFSRLKRHQEFALASSIKGCAGVVLEFRANNACYFVPIVQFLEIKGAIGKKSLNRSDLESLSDAKQCIRMPQDTTSRERRVYYSVEPIREWVRALATSGIAKAKKFAYQEFLAQKSMSVEEWKEVGRVVKDFAIGNGCKRQG